MTSHTRSGECAAFTLIELLAVMAIILVLAALIINIAGSAQYNSAKARATSEISAMSTALESYKADNGAYPSESTTVNGGSPTTEVLDAQDSSYTDPSKYVEASEFLYQALAGYTLSGSSGSSGTTGNGQTFSVSKRYINFRPDQLHATGSATVASPTSPYMYIIDPFGFSYGYSTVYAATQAANQASSQPSTTTATKGYNPTFDLWSTAGYASGGKSTPSNLGSSSISSLWIKNW